MNEVKKIGPDSAVLDERLRILKDTIPECFSEGKLDPEKLREILGESNLEEGLERYGLFWPGKREARARAFKPSKMALHRAPKEGVDEKKTRNLIIEGENLEVLKLLSKAYRGRVKMIYIDPPYNTGNDFVYDDKFAENPLEFEKRTGLRAEDGTALQTNRKSSGRYHSSWLSMILPRLLLSRELLCDSGLIFVSIDDNEAHNLIHVLDEVFGPENFIANIAWEKRYTRSNNARMFYSVKDSIIVFRKSALVSDIREPRSEKANSIYGNPDNDPRGPWTSSSFVNPATKEKRPNLVYDLNNPNTGGIVRHPTHAWKYEKSEYLRLAADNRLWWGKAGDAEYPRLKVFLSEADNGMVPIDLWNYKDSGTTDDGGAEIKELFGSAVFDTAKPVQLIRRMLKLVQSPDNDDIILDFFGGSGTTAQAVLEENEEDGGSRHFILVQAAEQTPEISEARKAGYDTIAEITKERVRRVIKKIEAEKGKLSDRDRGFRVYKLAKTGFKEWRDYEGSSLEEYEKQLSLHLAETDDKAREEDLVAEIMLREGFPLDSTVERLEEGSLAVTKVESESSAHRLFVCLDEGFGRSLTVRTFEKLGIAQEDVFVCLDSALSDEAKLRIRELCRLATI